MTITQKSPVFIQDFLKSHIQYNKFNLTDGISIEGEKSRLSIRLAKLSDALNISNLIKEVYNGTYPYKEMVDINKIIEMINDPNFYWLIYKLNENELIGSLLIHIDSENRSGTAHGFTIKKQYQGNLNNFLKITIAAFYHIYNIHEKKVLIWYCEIRSAHSKAQYIGSILGFKPIAFLPLKDIFFNQKESDFLFVLYDNDTLKNQRSLSKPQIIKEVLKCYSFSSKKYILDIPIVKNPSIQYDKKKMREILKNLDLEKSYDNFDNENYKIIIKNSKSYIKFKHNNLIKSVEKTEFKVKNIEELYIFTKCIKKICKSQNIRYFECYLSAYNPIHQKVFLNAGFKPFGYIPALKYNKEKNNFEDQILFIRLQISTKKSINNNIKLTSETKELLNSILPKYFLTVDN
jgi:RimJ/RimL family protein N-acetyltransferase